MRCRKCLMPNTRPDTQFVKGVCSACIAYENRPQVDWDSRKEELTQLLERYDGRCLVPSSGGKDSHYQVLTLLEMGADVTVLTATTCHLTKVGRKNIGNLSNYANTIEITPNKTVRAKLNRLALKMVGDISWPEHVLIHTLPFKVAMDMNIPLVFYGENPTNQYGGPMDRQTELKMTRQWTQEFGGFLGMRPQDFVGMEGLTERDMKIYMGPTDQDLEDKVSVYFLGQFIPWDSHENANKAIQHGFKTLLPSKANWWNFENLDNAQTGLHDYMMWLKYGYGRACAQISVDIRSGRITRDDAVNELRRREGVFPVNYAGVDINDMLEQINMSYKELEHILQDYEPVCKNHSGLAKKRKCAN